MDRSRDYIDLCTSAREIQKCWEPSHGDFYVDADDQICCWLCQDSKVSKIKKGFKISTTGNLIQLLKSVWLPRQDQLIEMAQIAGRTYDSVTLEFFNWTKAGYGNEQVEPGKRFFSLEQLWLAFLMHQKFNKWRVGCDWVDESGPDG